MPVNALNAIYYHIENAYDSHLNKLQAYLRQPSISATGQGIKQCAQLLAEYYHDLGCQEVSLVPTPGHPGVFAYYDAGAAVTVAVYGMYDVQPVEGQPWRYDPFAAELVEQDPFEQVVIARGAYNSKGPYRLFLNALESIIAVEGRLPVNLLFLSDGEEEIGSPHYPGVITSYQERLQAADVLLDIEANQNKDGKLITKLGNKGIVYLELCVSGQKWGRGPKRQPIHSSNKAVVDSPAWRLVQALSTMTTPDGNTILIDGIYDNVAPPTTADQELIETLNQVFDDTVYAELWGVDRWIGDLSRQDWIQHYLFSPSLNINGLDAGHTGEGTLTIVPHQARAKLDIRLVPDMEPGRVVRLLREHLDRHGYQDIEIDNQIAYHWNKTAVTEPAVQTMLDVYRQHQITYEVWPFSAGSEPLYLFTQPPFQLPMIRFGVGHGSKNHAPDEYLVVKGNGRVAGLIESEKAYVDLIYALAAT